MDYKVFKGLDILGKDIASFLETGFFRFEPKELVLIYSKYNGKPVKACLYNFPENIDEMDVSIFREAGAAFAKKHLEKEQAFAMLSFKYILTKQVAFGSDINFVCAFIEGVLFASYSFELFKSSPKKPLKEIAVFAYTDSFCDDFIICAKELIQTFKNVNMVRDLVNMPANYLTPQIFWEYISKKLEKGVKAEVWDEKTIEKNGLGLVAAVGRGSANPPRFISLEYNGAKGAKQIALVGKGVTFDTGGTNLKPSDAQNGMKADMGGAAAVVGAVNLISAMKLEINIRGYIPLVENIIGGDAIKTGDIVKSLSGKTVEILNTDAEGRLILADALTLAVSKKPDMLVDIATLTGACEIALGEHCAGFFTNSTLAGTSMRHASAFTGEDIWELPLYQPYAERLKSENADLRNLVPGPRYGGAIIAALFLKEFVNNTTWIHLDIAGQAFLEKSHPVFGSNASGFGVRLLYRFVQEIVRIKRN